MKKKLILCLSIVLATGSIGLVSAMANSKKSLNNNKIFQKYENTNVGDLKKSLKKLNKKQLLEEVNELSKDVDQTNLTPVAIEIIERVDEFEYSDLISEIKDDTNTENFSDLMVDAYILKSEKNNEKKNKSKELKKLLKDSKIKTSTKSKIILDVEMDESDVVTLNELIYNSDDDISASSLKKLSIIDENSAKIQGEKLIKNKENISEKKLSSAQKAMVKGLRSNQNKKDNLAFIETNLEIFEEASSDLLKDSSIFSLAEIKDVDAFRSIINHNDIDLDLKVYTIDFNYKILEDLIIQDKPTDEDINLIIYSMEIHPILDLKDKLVNLRDEINNKSIDNENKDIIERLNNVIDNVNKNGAGAIYK